MVDGLWFDCLMSPAKFDRQAAKRTCLAYLAAVFPALLLNYYGQGALLLTSPAAASDPFFPMAPRWISPC